MNKKQVLLLQLLERSGPRLQGMLTRLMLDEHAAEELMQDLFIRLFEMEHIESIGNLQAYAYRVAINLAFDRRRKLRLFSEVSDNQPDYRLHPVDQQMIQSEQLHQILNALEQLSVQMRECLVLRYIEQMNDCQIAERLQKTPQQVRGLCSKGLDRIRQILNKQEASFYKEAVNE